MAKKTDEQTSREATDATAVLEMLAEMQAQIEILSRDNAELSKKVGEADPEKQAELIFKAREEDIEKFLEAEQPESHLYVVKNTGPQNIKKCQHNIEVILSEIDPATKRERDGVVLTFRKPDKNIGEELDKTIVMFCDVTEQRNVIVTPKEAQQGYFEFRGQNVGLPEGCIAKQPDGGWRLAQIFEGLFHMPRHIQKEIMDGPEFKAHIEGEYRALLERKRRERLTKEAKSKIPKSAFKRGDALKLDMAEVG